MWRLLAAAPHGQSPPLAVLQLGSCASSRCAFRLWIARHTPRARPSHWAPGHCLGSSSEPPPKPPISPPWTMQASPLAARGGGRVGARGGRARGRLVEGAGRRSRLRFLTSLEPVDVRCLNPTLGRACLACRRSSRARPSLSALSEARSRTSPVPPWPPEVSAKQAHTCMRASGSNPATFTQVHPLRSTISTLSSQKSRRAAWCLCALRAARCLPRRRRKPSPPRGGRHPKSWSLRATVWAKTPCLLRRHRQPPLLAISLPCLPRHPPLPVARRLCRGYHASRHRLPGLAALPGARRLCRGCLASRRHLPGRSHFVTRPAPQGCRAGSRADYRTEPPPRRTTARPALPGAAAYSTFGPGSVAACAIPGAKAQQRAATSAAYHLRPHARRLTAYMGNASVAGQSSFDAIDDPGAAGAGGGSGGGGADGAGVFPSHFPAPPVFAGRARSRPADGGSGAKPPPAKKGTALPFPAPPSRCR